MHIQVNANTLVFFRTSKSAASVTSSQGKKVDLSAFAAMDEDEVRDDDDSGPLFDDDEEDEVQDYDGDDDVDEEEGEEEDKESDDEEEKPRKKLAATKKAVEGHASKEAKKPKGPQRGRKPAPKGKSKPKGKSAPKKRALESSKSSSSSITPNPFYASTADSQAGTLVRGSPDRSKAKTAQGGPLRDPEAEKMRITREINARMLKVHHVNGKALGNGEEPEHFVIDIPNRFIR